MNSSARPLFDGSRVFLGTSDGGDRLLAVRPTGSGDVTGSHVAWRQNRNVPNRTSLLLVDGRLVMVSMDGVVSALDAESGRPLWTERLKGRFWASPIYAGGRAYFFDDEGVGTVAEVDKGWKLVAANKLDGGCMASPAASGGSLFVRTKTHVYCIEGKD
jgi:outer membrane protein assembly factor BamB